MLDNLQLSPIADAAKAVTTKEVAKPSPESVVSALITAEKEARKSKADLSLASLVGSWRLCFITGTKKDRDRAGIVLGAGKYVPSWTKITITYKNEEFTGGKVDNLVEIGPFKLCLSGPIKLLSNRSILAFDFTRMTLSLFGLKLYSGYIRNGKNSEAKFAEISLKDVGGFFVYFLVKNDYIAARGKGGGLAVWGKV